MLKQSLLALFAFAIAAGFACVPVYWAAITMYPARTSDGHPVMPIGQVAIAIVAAGVVGLIAAIAVIRHRPR